MISEKRKLELLELIQERATELNQYDKVLNDSITKVTKEERVYISHHACQLLNQSNTFAINMLTALEPALTETIVAEVTAKKTVN